MVRNFLPIALGSLCLCTSSCDRIKKKQQEREALRDIKDSSSEMLKSVEMTDTGMKLDYDKLEGVQKTLKQSGEKMGGKVGEAMKIIADLQGGMNQQGKKCGEVTEEVIPCFNLETLSAKRDYAERVEKFNKLIAVNEATLEVFENFRPEIKKRLDAIGMVGKERDDFDRGFARKWDKTATLVKTVRQADIEMGKIGITLMQGLQKGDSQWKWSEKQKQASFQTDEQVEWYNSLMKRISDLGESQTQAQQELVQHMKTP